MFHDACLRLLHIQAREPEATLSSWRFPPSRGISSCMSLLEMQSPSVWDGMCTRRRSHVVEILTLRCFSRGLFLLGCLNLVPL